jgi:hypothetical protein
MESAMIEVEAPLDTAVQQAKSALETHPVFARITSVSALRAFMQVHVYAVWDFMSLAKRLQRDYTCLELPWMPPADIKAARLLNEIILGEESDVGPDGTPASHLELYLGAMAEVGASTVQFEDFLGCLRAGASPESALKRANVPHCAVDFVRHTLQVALYGSTITVLANFFHGRENIIPGMFRGLLRDWGIARTAAPRFAYYLDRHIELDGDSHGPAAASIIERALQRDPAQRTVARAAALAALEARRQLWDGTLHLLDCLQPQQRKAQRERVTL